MAQREPQPQPSLGFLTVVEHEQHGLFGGYLLLNGNGRPLEFHCTAPIRPNRAQQILYGPTLEPYIYGEQIGQTLVAKSQLEPMVIITDQRPMLAVRELIAPPVALLAPLLGLRIAADVNSDEAGETNGLLRFPYERHELAVWPDRAADQALIQARLAELTNAWDLAEPFGRIRGAIEEAQRATVARAA